MTLEKRDDSQYGFDPSSIMKMISENPEIGLAIIQVPIRIANTILKNHNDLKWTNNPTKPGYYWVKSHDEVISIKEYSSKEIEVIINTGLNGIIKNLFKFAGPLQPPE